MKEPLTLIFHAQWCRDFSIASHGAFFHALEEVLRGLVTAIEKAGEARLVSSRVLARHGVAQILCLCLICPINPEIS